MLITDGQTVIIFKNDINKMLIRKKETKMKRKELQEITEALFLIDMNNGFCEEGSLADSSIKKIVPNIKEIIKQILNKGEGFFVVNDSHTNKSTELKRFPEHCLKDSKESKTIKELAIFEDYATAKFYKNSTCALFAPGLMDALLKMNQLKKVIIVGCCTDICIMNFAIALRNFFDELNLDIEIIVPTYAVETYHIPVIHDREEKNKQALEWMENSGITLKRTKKEGINNEY